MANLLDSALPPCIYLFFANYVNENEETQFA